MVAGLLPGTSYHFTLVANTSGGTTKAADQTFTTAPIGTGQRAAALKKCKKKHSARALKRCRKKARLLPV